ncbi:flagellar biosynthetic protein FliO [Paenibacillus harenae]|uniref:flagellar biosynthetic protein FliO n=1 Tax=Paenibacillus harenae TaxID=306543 RepID=UPI002793F243|nr:flagellar biosynthetic protein FliO [Paenibacillus harenae]MDQ0059673.1 flagellar protein FliO/FliZ [Paenibacillus harenae]
MANLFSRVSIASVLGTALLPGIASAAEETVDNAAKDEQMVFSGSESLAGSFIWVIVSLAIVIVLIVLVIKWLSQRNRAWGTNRSLRSLGGIALGQNNSVQVVEIAGRIYIVGIGENITLLDKVVDPEEAKAIIESLERQPDHTWPQNALTQLVSKLRGRNAETDKQPANEQWNHSTSFQSMLQSKLSQQSDRKQQLESLLNDTKTNERLIDDDK